jgi:dTDP-4-amino-4,6-dideoxygalactose transaminase
VRPPAPIPQFTLARQYKLLGREIEAAVKRVLRSRRYVLGPETEALESEVAGFIHVPHAIACASGTDALHLALRALELPAGAAVLTTPFTFFATTGAILLAQLRPVFADIDPRTFNLSAALAAEKLAVDSSIGCVTAVDLYGRAAALDEMVAGESRKLPLIEDAAQAFGGFAIGGSKRQRRMAGTLGTIGCLSFYPTKNLGALGEGGMVVTQDPAIAERVRAMRQQGSRRRYAHDMLGWNARMHELQAAALRVKLQHVERWNRKRAQIAARYEAALLASGCAQLSDGGPAVQRGARARDGGPVVLPERTPGHAFHQYVIRAQARDQLRDYLRDCGIGSEVYYPTPVHLQPAMASYGLVPGAFPEAECAAREVLALPMFPELTEAEVERVSSEIVRFYRSQRALGVSSR